MPKCTVYLVTERCAVFQVRIGCFRSCLWTMKRHNEMHRLGLSSILGGDESADALLLLSNGPVSHYLPWELRALTFGLCVSLHIYCMHTIFQCAIAFVRADDLKNLARCFKVRLILMWINGCLLFVSPHSLSVCPSVSFLLVFPHFLCLESTFCRRLDGESKCQVEVTLSRPTCLAEL